ncbi:TetR/AcrR family transcriptional regulator [Streptomyces sp. NPDC059477]|uniref:TetR/AcrR family transcriptional regulator n=1 Tax=Streptomyces sp. NPDC059477 TaxID=3346847 RepID=UPI0036B98CEB
MADTGTTPRERYRAQVRAEIKAHAWEQIATAGASALSLNAIAKQMGMSGPALYRYFANRDDLITELIRDAYRSLADSVQEAAASGAALPALAHALRAWALADPQRYLLIYGTPVPGYHAPDDVTAISNEIMSVLLDAAVAPAPPGPYSAASHSSGPDSPDPHSPEAASPADTPPANTPPTTTTPLEAHLADHRRWADGHSAATPPALRTALTFWSRLHGVLSLELAGHFTGMGFDPDVLFEEEVSSLRGGV